MVVGPQRHAPPGRHGSRGRRPSASAPTGPGPSRGPRSTSVGTSRRRRRRSRASATSSDGTCERSTFSRAIPPSARWRCESVSPGIATSSGSSSKRTVNGSARVSSWTADPANATRPRVIPTASTQPNPRVARERRDPAGDERFEGHGQPTRPMRRVGGEVLRIGDRGGVGQSPVRRVQPGPDAQRQRDPRLRPAEVAGQHRPGSDPGRTAARERVVRRLRRRTGQRVVSATGSPSAIARSAAASSSGRRVAGTGRLDDEAVGAGRQQRVDRRSRPCRPSPSRGGPAPLRASVDTWRRGPRARSTTTRSPSTRPSGPVLRLWNVSNDRAWVFVTSSAGSIEPARTTTTPTPRQGRRGRRGDGPPQVRRPVVRRRAGGAHRPGHDDRLRACVEEVVEERRLLDRVGALDDDHAVDRRSRRAPPRTEPQIPNSAGNVKWLAGVRPRSIATTSAISSRPGVWARISAPDRAGT